VNIVINLHGFEERKGRSLCMAIIREINEFFIEDICYRYALGWNIYKSYCFCFPLRPNELNSDYSLFVTKSI